MDRPRPVPSPTSLVVKNGSKILCSRPGGMPGPESANATSTAAGPTELEMRIALRGESGDRVAHEQAGVVGGVVELGGAGGGELAERGELSRLDELLLLVAQLLFALLHLGRGLPQVTHDVDHGLPAGLQTQLVIVRVLQDVQQGSPRIVQPLRLAGQPPAVPLVVGAAA